ncbi:hypothetical protein HDU86_007600 [Geranomyces michiganensis]|nr:hypothetical protein HDU86_007600 [Geranomyces michiganensis]
MAGSNDNSTNSTAVAALAASASAVKPAPISTISSPQPLPPPPPAASSTRLYIGNLPPTLSEYHLASLFSPFGPLSKIDYLWHKHGPRRGEPRGYCFIEYESAQDARAAVGAADTKAGGEGIVVMGRRLVVSFSADGDEEGVGEEGGGRGGGGEKAAGGGSSSAAATTTSTAAAGGTPTTARKRTKGALDVARNNRQAQEPVNAKLQARVAHTSMDTKISAIERKLMQLQQSSQQQHSKPSLSSSSSSSSSSPLRSRGGGSSLSAATTTAPNVRHQPYSKR